VTAIIDPTLTFRLVTERLAVEENPRLRQVLQATLDHMEAEASGDFERLVATLAPDPAYHQWGSSPVDNGPKGRAGVEEFYRNFIASGCDVLHHDIDRLTVDTHTIVTEGEIRIAYPGAVLAAQGFPVDDVDSYYLYRSRMCIVWAYDDDAKLLAEDSYATGDGFLPLRKIEDHELPEELQRRIAAQR
jgi:hypothetical protein